MSLLKPQTERTPKPAAAAPIVVKEAYAGQKWDYTTRVLHGGFLGRHKEELNRKAFEAQLDELGQQGWELTWILMEQALQAEKDGHVLIFRRPV